MTQHDHDLTNAAHIPGIGNPSYLMPEQPTSPQPAIPMLYVDDKIEIEYKRLTYDMAENEPPDENTLNKLGTEGWELVGIVGHHDKGHFYFKRSKR